MTRRGFMRSVSATCLYLSVLPAGLAGTGTSLVERDRDRHLRRLIEPLFTDVASARAVGRSYIAAFPDIAAGAAGRIRELLLTPRQRQRDFPERLLSVQRRDDFSSGRTVVIDGWVIARCEADLCAALLG
jgi:hypothetical protein